MAKIVIDAGHGGERDPGAVYGNRQEKNDALSLALAVGEKLQRNGIEVVFTRTEDIYQSPLEKAQLSNEQNPDFLISIHRNSSPEPNQYTGVETLVFRAEGPKAALAEEINRRLEEIGFQNLGVRARPGLVILRRTRNPALLIEAGFINSDADNALFDQQFDAIAEAIAGAVTDFVYANPNTEIISNQAGVSNLSEGVRNQEAGMANPGVEQQSGDHSTWGISRQLAPNDERDPERTDREKLYRVQTGAFRNQGYAQDMLYQLVQQGYPATLQTDDGYYKVQVGAFHSLDNAIKMEAELRRRGYSTYLVYSEGDTPLLYRCGEQNPSLEGARPLLSVSGGCQGCVADDVGIAPAQPCQGQAIRRT